MPKNSRVQFSDSLLGAVALMAFDSVTGNVYIAAINNSQYISYNGNPENVIWELVPALHDIATKAK